MGDKFNENLKNARERKEITQKEMAERIGVAKSTYSLYESGNREPNVQTIKKIADVLEVTADELLGLENDPIPVSYTHLSCPAEELQEFIRRKTLSISKSFHVTSSRKNAS